MSLTRIIILLFTFCNFVNISLQSIASTRMYCESETFQARCWLGEVIMIESALYGRMRIGRCVEADLGYLGCQANVLDIVDRLCSGKTQCDIRIPDAELDASKPCYKELKVYLEVAYKCVRALSQADIGCKGTVPIEAALTPDYLSSLSSQALVPVVPPTPPPSPACPPGAVRIEVQPGQRINLTLMNFAWRAPDRKSPAASTPSGSCPIFGHVIDGERRVSLTECGTSERETLVYTSDSTSLVVVLTPRRHSETQFLIKYQATGCANLKTPPDTKLERNGEEATFSCLATRQTWFLRCQDNQWVGVVGNCTHHTALIQARFLESTQSAYSVSHGAIIMFILGIALLLCAIIVAVGILVVRRSRSQYEKTACHLRYDNVCTTDDDYLKAYTAVAKGNSVNVKDSELRAGEARSLPPSSGAGGPRRSQYHPIWLRPLPPDPRPLLPPPATDGGSIPSHDLSVGVHQFYGEGVGPVSGGNRRFLGNQQQQVYHGSGSEGSSRYYLLDRARSLPQASPAYVRGRSDDTA